MKTAAETLSPTRVKLTVEVPYDELKPSIDAAYVAIGSQISVPGFRKGKVPARIIDQRVGRGAVLQEAINEALPNFYGQAVEEAEVRPIGQPEVEVTAVPMDDSEPLAFTAEVDVRPEITLPDLDTIAVTVDDVVVTDEDITERLDQLRTRFGTLVPVERAAGLGDFVSIDLAATIGEESIDEVAGISYEVGSGNMLIGLDEALTGLSAGESATFTAPLAGGDHAGGWGIELIGSSKSVRILAEIYPAIYVRDAEKWSPDSRQEIWRRWDGDIGKDLSAEEKGFGPANARVVDDWLQSIAARSNPECSGKSAA